MSDPYYIHSLEIAGFRAYLVPKNFDFDSKKCMAIFAPNGKGKSSIIDALEFMFSTDGTLERLGLRTVNNKAGVVALAHILAEESKITPSVTIGCAQGRDITVGKRDATGTKRQIPSIASTLNKCFTVNPIIRGHALRAFVESHSPEDRYTDVATWLRLGPLVEVQKNLRLLRTQIKAAAEDTDVLRRINFQLGKEIPNSGAQWNNDTIVDYINTLVLAPLDKNLSITSLSTTDFAYTKLINNVKTEEEQIGLASLRQIRQAALMLWQSHKNENEEIVTTGAIPAFELAVINLLKAENTEIEERGKAANAAFQSVWNAAKPFFDGDAATPDVCPVCDTPVSQTSAGSIAGIRTHIATHLEELAGYAKAKKGLDDAKINSTREHGRLNAVLPSLLGLLTDSESDLKEQLTSYRTAVEAWENGNPPSADTLIGAISALTNTLNAKIAEIEAKQGDHTYAKAKSKIDRILELQEEYFLTIRTQQELEKLSEALNLQATVISSEIRKKVQVLLDKLQSPMNDIYKLIQGAGAVPLRLELPSEDDTNQQRLNLVIDFANNRTSVPPGGYLSDSQIHSVALALRLAAIRKFNEKAPIIALDDIVTSYDADHRRTIAGLIATKFDDCQILITSHDERFFNYLKDQAEAKSWQFSRIIDIDPVFGPRFADHKVSDEMVESRWDAGQSAANEMRQAEEEWLISICRDFGASVRIRPLERAYSYERSELASALASFLKSAKLDPQPVAGVNNRFLTSLQKGEIENFGSHFQEAPYGDGSIGDEKTRWDEFKEFRKQFSCLKCNRIRFKRPYDLRIPVCASQGCETQFKFVTTD